jgi:putative pyruvate formate lyase activating enzyme
MGLRIAINSGFHLPLVYNTGGYELARIISLLEGVIDIYLPDMRYGDEKMAVQYSNAPGYPGYNQAAVLEMHRQVGIAQIGKDGIIKKGLIVRHLVLPGNISGTSQIMRFIAEELSTQTYISLMSQYLPYHRAKEFGKINRRLTENEYAKAKDIMEGYGLHNGWIQESYGQERFAGVHIKPSLRKDDAS